MRKVHHTWTHAGSLRVAVVASVGLTALVFAIIPFSHLVNRPQRTLELRRTGTADLPPPAEEPTQAQAAPEVPPVQDTPPEPQLAAAPQQIPLSANLDIAVGSGGALAGFGEVRSLITAQSIQDETFDVSELEKKPEPVSQVPPIYPAELRKAKLEGLATLVFILNEEGRVEQARVESSSRPEFDKPALDAIRKWRFRPGLRNGQAVRTFIRQPMRFRVSSQ